ncbi:hypothetical protein AB0K52_06385 [Glycomyces sp. NPDC049804]|uniref:hypothetical protein n=1 Tax=Glycomyces sp. NPDC049804 TaxID=3154363 RepID=UPI00342CB91E
MSEASSRVPNGNRSRYFLIGAAVAVLAVVLIVFYWRNMSDTPPEATYTQAEAYAPMEQAVAETVEVLPDFPGFSARGWYELPCSHSGVDDPDYTNIEISYSFSDEVSADALARQQYVGVLRDQWTQLGYSVEVDEGAGEFYDLSVVREDGIKLWYRVARVVSLKVQSGCVPASESSEIPYIPPSGGVVPGSANDGVADYFPDGIPTENLTADAVDPFATPTGVPSDE